MAEEQLRLPPQNLDAERGVLGSILLMNEAIDEVGESLKADHFYADRHQKIFAAVMGLYENGVRGIDAVTLAEELDRRKELDEIGGVEYLETQDARLMFYDVNANSNLRPSVAQAFGFDPFERVADFLAGELRRETRRAITA